MHSESLKLAMEAVRKVKGVVPSGYVSRRSSSDRPESSQGGADPKTVPVKKTEKTPGPKTEKTEKTPKAGKAPHATKRSRADRGKEEAVVAQSPSKKGRPSEEELAARAKRGITIRDQPALQPATVISPPTQPENYGRSEPQPLNVIKPIGGDKVSAVSASGSTAALPAPLDIKRALCLHEKAAAGLSITSPLALTTPASVDEASMKLYMECGKIMMCRAQAMMEFGGALYKQFENQNFVLTDTQAQKEKAELDLKEANTELVELRAGKTKMETSIAQMTEDLRKLRLDAETWFKEKKKLQSEKEELGKSLELSREETKAARAETVSTRAELSRELQQAKDELKTVQDKLYVTQEEMANVFLGSFNNALAQVDLRNHEVVLQFDGVRPDHEVDGNSIIRKNEDGSTTVIWSLASLPNTPAAGDGLSDQDRPEEEVIPPDLEQRPPSLVSEQLPNIVDLDDWVPPSPSFLNPEEKKKMESSQDGQGKFGH